MNEPILMLITNGKSEHPDIKRKIKEACAAGISILQLREKELPADRLINLALEMRAVTQLSGNALLINERADIALAVEADGVHLPESCLMPSAIKPFDPRWLVGVSVHSLAAALKAEQEGADYVVFGPVFETPSKKQFDKPQGISALKALTCELAIPVVAVGGIGLDNAELCLEAGARGLAMISAILESDDPAEKVYALKKLLGCCYEIKS